VILYPAIDILEGRAVRLVQGRFDEPTVYEDHPLQAAHAWARAGARWLHVVDLDGARAGEPVNLDHVRAIADSVPIPIQVGGGLRSAEAIDAALAAGASRVVIGTAAYDEGFLAAVLADHGDRVAVAVDVREGSVSAKGWTESTGLSPSAVIARLVDQGVATIVYTDVDRDGLLAGPDVDALAEIARAAAGSRLIYSGGIGALDQLAAIGALGLRNLDGVIVGKALYEQRFTVVEAQDALVD
jgi:phosphoribosylformimino-5-aminoimidazole carboxamide ribotide isomerase